MLNSNLEPIINADKLGKVFYLRIDTTEKLNDFIKEALRFDLYLIGFTASPIKGKEGNSEYLLYFNKGSLIDYIREVNVLC